MNKPSPKSDLIITKIDYVERCIYVSLAKKGSPIISELQKIGEWEPTGGRTGKISVYPHYSFYEIEEYIKAEYPNWCM